MAIHTRHPVSAPPGPPARERTGHLLLRGWCVLVLALALAGTAWAPAIAPVATVAVALGSGLVSAALWMLRRPPLQYRRLPWFVLAYLAWAAASLTWTAWGDTTVVTWLLLAATTVHGIVLAAVLSWRDIVRALASALKWVLGASLLVELAASLLGRGPLLPGGPVPAERGDLLGGGRIAGVLGSADLLGAVAALGLVVFAIRWAARAPRRGWLVAWMALAGILLGRAGSVTAVLSLAAAGVVLSTVLLMRTARPPGERTRFYALYAAVALGAGAALWFGRAPLAGLLGRGADLAAREALWSRVWERAAQHPLLGWGFATPRLPGDGAVAEGAQAHSMWLDAYLQLGGVGVVLLALVFLAFVWRAWFFAVDRPRYDLRADRPYSPLTLLPTLVGALLLVQGIGESHPLLPWGWMLVTLFAVKITQSPLVGIGPAEQAPPEQASAGPGRANGSRAR